MKRTARTPGTRHRGWRKGAPATGVTTENRSRLLERAARDGDAAALVQVVEDARERGEAVPAWVSTCLRQWLAEFVAELAPPKLPLETTDRYRRWGRGYMRQVRDAMTRDVVEGYRDVHGFGWDEACDAASVDFEGTDLAGSPAAIRRRGKKPMGRSWTMWEARVFLPRTLGTSRWWQHNEVRQGANPGEWQERPDLLRARERVGKTSGRKSPRT